MCAERACPMCRQEGGKLVMHIELSPDEAADYLNFVIKDAGTNTWFDANGSNFQLALRNSLRSFMSIDDSEFVRIRRRDPQSMQSPNPRYSCGDPPPCAIGVSHCMCTAAPALTLTHAATDAQYTPTHTPPLPPHTRICGGSPLLYSLLRASDTPATLPPRTVCRSWLDSQPCEGPSLCDLPFLSGHACSHAPRLWGCSGVIRVSARRRVRC